MEMDFHRPNELTNCEAIQIVGQFFPHEWRQLRVEDVEITRSQTGINNEVYFVSRKDVPKSETQKVVIRVYSSMMGGREGAKEKNAGFGMKATEVEQILILNKLADRGLGPRLLGVFDGGRVEEFLDCRKITFEETYDPVMEADVAKNLARIHATKVPLRKPSCEYLTVLRQAHEIVKLEIPFFQSLRDDGLLNAVTHDFEADFKFMEPFMEWKHNRMVLINWDPHMDNVCVLNHEIEGRLKSVIFDFEMGGNNIRGKDLGLFIISRSGFFPIVREDRKLESKEETERFLKAYQAEIVNEFDDIDVNGKDSIDHLMIESLIGSMVSCGLFLLLIAGRCAKTGEKDAISEKIMPFLVPLLQGFTQSRQAIESRFPNYVCPNGSPASCLCT